MWYLWFYSFHFPLNLLPLAQLSAPAPTTTALLLQILKCECAPPGLLDAFASLTLKPLRSMPSWINACL